MISLVNAREVILTSKRSNSSHN